MMMKNKNEAKDLQRVNEVKLFRDKKLERNEIDKALSNVSNQQIERLTTSIHKLEGQIYKMAEPKAVSISKQKLKIEPE